MRDPRAPDARRSFLFWQQYHDSPEGSTYKRFYLQNDPALPHIGVVDPVTGQLVKKWSGFKARLPSSPHGAWACSNARAVRVGRRAAHRQADGLRRQPAYSRRLAAKLAGRLTRPGRAERGRGFGRSVARVRRADAATVAAARARVA